MDSFEENVLKVYDAIPEEGAKYIDIREKTGIADRTLCYILGARLKSGDLKKEFQKSTKSYLYFRTEASRVPAQYDNNKSYISNSRDNLRDNNIKETSYFVDVSMRGRAYVENPAEYPSDPEEIVEAARSCGYVMSVYEASKFFSTYAAVGWIDRNGTVIRNWRALLPIWKVSQSPKQRSDALKEAKRRSAGLPPIDPDTKIYEYYEDAQGRKWRKRPEDSDWEEIFEEITFSDGTKAIKGVV